MEVVVRPPGADRLRQGRIVEERALVKVWAFAARGAAEPVAHEFAAFDQAAISGSFRSATSRSRSIAALSSGDADSNNLISSSVRPARCAVSMTASVRTVPGSYLRRPLTRTGGGNSPVSPQQPGGGARVPARLSPAPAGRQGGPRPRAGRPPAPAHGCRAARWAGAVVSAGLR